MFIGHVCKVLKSNIHLQAVKGIQFRGSEAGDTLNLSLLIQMHVVRSQPSWWRRRLPYSSRFSLTWIMIQRCWPRVRITI